jgi:hypothetical protein
MDKGKAFLDVMPVRTAFGALLPLLGQAKFDRICLIAVIP